MNGIATFQGRAALGTWIHRVALTTALSLHRRERRRRLLRARWPEDGGRVDAPATILRLQLTAALEQLPASMQTVLRLHDIEGYRHSEIADKLRVAESTSRSQLFEGRLRVRRALTGVAESRKRA